MDEITIYLIVAGVLLLLGFAALLITCRKANPKGNSGGFFDAAADVIDAIV